MPVLISSCNRGLPVDPRRSTGGQGHYKANVSSPATCYLDGVKGDSGKTRTVKAKIQEALGRQRQRANSSLTLVTLDDLEQLLTPAAMLAPYQLLP